MSVNFIPGQEKHDPNGNEIKGCLFVRSTHYTFIDRYASSFVVIAHISGADGLNDTFEEEYYSIIFNDPIHIDIRTHEDAFSSDYTDSETGEFSWERGKLFLEGISGFEEFSHSQFLLRFGEQEPIHGPYDGETFENAKHLPTHFRFADGEQVIHVLTNEKPIITPNLKKHAATKCS